MDIIKMSSIYGEFGNKNKIELRTLKFKVEPTIIQQIDKIREEDDEFIRAILKCDQLNAIEDIVKGQDKHFNKLLKRGWEFDE